MDCDKVGKYLTELRKEKGLTQEQLAEIIGVSNKTISKWETGINVPDTYFLYALSKEFNVSVQDILNGEKIYNIMDSNNVVIKTINFYNNMFRKKTTRIITSLVILFIILFSILYTFVNFNKNKIYDICSSSDNYFINGYLVYNPNEAIFLINNFNYENEYIGTEFEPFVSKYEIFIKNYNDNILLFSGGKDFEKEIKLSEFLNSLNISFVTNKNELKHSKTNLINKTYIQIIFSNSKSDNNEIIIDLNMKNHYSNSKIIY